MIFKKLSWWKTGRFIFLPKNMMWSINGRWADQSISKPSNTRSDRNITAMLLLQGERTVLVQLIITQINLISCTRLCKQVESISIVNVYLWKPGVGWRLSGKKSERGAKYPPYAGMGRGYGTGDSLLLFSATLAGEGPDKWISSSIQSVHQCTILIKIIFLHIN